MARGMPRGWEQADFIADPVVGLDQIDKAGVPHRRHRIGEDYSHVLALALLVPMLIFYTADQIPRFGEGRDPAAPDQHRVPPHMVDMKMGAHDRVDRLARKAGAGEITEKARLHPVPTRNAAVLLVVAEAGVDDDAPVRRLDDERMDAHLEPAALIGEIGL